MKININKVLTNKNKQDILNLLNEQIFENRIGSRKAVASELRQVPGSNPKRGADVW